MVSYKEYVAGWLDSSIPNLLAAFPPNLVSHSFALITCLDSNPGPASLLEKIPFFRDTLGAVGHANGLLMPARMLQEPSIREQLFFGFDEIWFFSNDRIEPQPETSCLVGPHRVDQDQLNKLGPWMTNNNCELALGDGVGLNFIVKAEGFVRYLITQSLAQPERA